MNKSTDQDKQKSYEPPRLEVVSFRADEVLAGVCASTEDQCGLFGPNPYEIGS